MAQPEQKPCALLFVHCARELQGRAVDEPRGHPFHDHPPTQSGKNDMGPRCYLLQVYLRKAARQSGSTCQCRCSKIMSPLNCNETLSPCKDGDDESERVPTVKVIENAADGRLSVCEASRLLQLSERQVQRLKRRYQPDSVGWVQDGNQIGR